MWVVGWRAGLGCSQAASRWRRPSLACDRTLPTTEQVRDVALGLARGDEGLSIFIRRVLLRYLARRRAPRK